MAPTPIGSIQGVEGLTLFGLQIFSTLWGLFHHPTAPIPASAAPAIELQMHGTPGATDEHRAVMSAALVAATK